MKIAWQWTVLNLNGRNFVAGGNNFIDRSSIGIHSHVSYKVQSTPKDLRFAVPRIIITYKYLIFAKQASIYKRILFKWKHF